MASACGRATQRGALGVKRVVARGEERGRAPRLGGTAAHRRAAFAAWRNAQTPRPRKFHCALTDAQDGGGRVGLRAGGLG